MHHDPDFPPGALRPNVEAELKAVEADPTFARAPVMRRLLRFLVTEALAGRGDKLKSYAIAVEALGREPDFDPQTDSYPRVQVARLRKLLEAHYARHAPVGDVQFRVPSSGYAVEFVSTASALMPEKRAKRSLFGWLAVVGALAIAVAAAVIGFPPAGEAWRTRNFPLIYMVGVVPLDGTAEQKNAAIDLGNGVSEALDRFTAIDVVRTPSPDADYRIDITLRAVPGGTRVNLVLTSLGNGRIVWARSGLRPPIEGRLFDVDEVAVTLSARLAQPAGIIHSDGDQRDIDPDTPYGCWLALRSYWQTMPPEDEARVRGCVEAWAKNDPRAAMARGARSWFFAQDALEQTGAQRAELLSNAYTEALKAVELQPNDPGAQYSLMRAALYLGYERQARAVGDRIVMLNGNNPEFMAGVGMFKVMMGDADGEAVLKKALSLHFNPPQWVQSGLFFAAVARDDPAAALKAAEEFQSPSGSPLQEAMMAMALARAGRNAEAAPYWQKALKAQPALAKTPRLLFAPLPLAPAIRERSLAWLELARAPKSAP